MIRIICIIAVCFTLQNACAKTEFVPGVEDLPFPETFSEQPDSTVNYDTPEGRIIYARGDSVCKKDMRTIKEKYTKTLLNLGWEQYKKDTFSRENESLAVHFKEKKGGKEIVLISLTPRPKKDM